MMESQRWRGGSQLPNHRLTLVGNSSETSSSQLGEGLEMTDAQVTAPETMTWLLGDIA